jgi:hypothetical protein
VASNVFEMFFTPYLFAAQESSVGGCVAQFHQANHNPCMPALCKRRRDFLFSHISSLPKQDGWP